MRAYVVITAGPGKAREIARTVAALPGVKMANACWAARMYLSWSKSPTRKNSTSS
jgi:hypothetical protein